MTEPLVIRINQILTEDDFRYLSRKLKQDNPNIIVLPEYCEVLHPQIIRCKDCENHGTRTNMCDIWHRHTNGEGYCHRAKAKSKEQKAKYKGGEEG